MRDAAVAAAPDEGVEHTLKMMQMMIHSLKMDVEMLKRRMDAGGEAETGLVRRLPAPVAPDYGARAEDPVYSDYAELSERPVPQERADFRAPAEEDDDEEDLNLEKMERRMIEKALRRSRNRRKVAADDLGISERTLYRKIKDYGIEE